MIQYNNQRYVEGAKKAPVKVQLITRVSVDKTKLDWLCFFLFFSFQFVLLLKVMFFGNTRSSKLNELIDKFVLLSQLKR